MPETIQGEVYFSAKEAGNLFGYTADYISKLAREGKVKTKRLGRSWYVSGSSVKRFFKDVEALEQARLHALSEERRGEYQSVNGAVSARPLPIAVHSRATGALGRTVIVAASASVFALFFALGYGVMRAEPFTAFSGIFGVRESSARYEQAPVSGEALPHAWTTGALAERTSEEFLRVRMKSDALVSRARSATYPEDEKLALMPPKPRVSRFDLSARMSLENLGRIPSEFLSWHDRVTTTLAFLWDDRGLIARYVSARAAGLYGDVGERMFAFSNEIVSRYLDSLDEAGVAVNDLGVALKEMPPTIGMSLDALLHTTRAGAVTLAAVAEGFNADIARAMMKTTTEAFSASTSWFTDFGSRIAEIFKLSEFSYTPLPHPVEVEPGEIPPVVTERIVERTPTTLIQNITEAVTISGISSEELARRLQELERRVIARIPSFSGPASVTVVNAQSFAHSQKIDQLANTSISSPTISGGSISGASSISATSISGTFSGSISGGTGSFSTLAAATTTLSGPFAVSSTATSTFAGQTRFSFAPTEAHTFGAWATGVANSAVQNAPLYINPASATADSNLFGVAVNDSVRFLVDAEGDVFANSITASGGVTLATTSASTFTVEGDTTLGDAITDNLTVNARLASDLIPKTANTYDLGTTTLGFRSGFFNTSLLVGNTATTTIRGDQATSTFSSGIEAFRQIASPFFHATSTTATSTFAGGVDALRLNTSATSTFAGLQIPTGGLSIGSLSGFLKATAGVVSTSLIDLANDVSGLLGVAFGGTGWGNIQANTLLIGNGAGQLATTTAGTNSQVLALVSGVPSWVATTTFSSGLTYAAGNVTADLGTSVDLAAEVTGDLPFSNLTQIAANSVLGNITGAAGDVAGIATSSLGIALSDTTGTLAVARGGTASTSPAGFLYGPNDGTLQGTTTISANFIDASIARDSELHSAVTLSGALDYITLVGQDIVRGAIDLATDVTGLLGVAFGGTGWGNIQANTLLVGNGAGQLATTTAGTNSQVLALVSGTPSWVATTTFSSGLTYSGGNVTADLGTSVDLASEVTGDLPFANLTQIAANSILGNSTGATGDVAGIATSSLYTGTNGQVLARVNGTWTGVATTSAGTGLSYDGTSFNVNTSQNIATLSNLTTNGFVRTGSGNGTLSVQTDPITIAQGGTATTTFYSGGLTFYNSTLGTLSQASAQSGLFYDNTNSRLGIGTTTPFAKLTVIGPDTLTSPTLSLRQSNDTSYGFDFDIESASVGRLDLYRVVADTRTQVLSVLRGSGNVGLGTTSPGTLLSLGDTGANTINISPTATSTFGSGINIRTGCFAVNGTCVGGGGSSTFLGLTDTPSSFTANRVPFTNSGATALTDSANLTFDGSLLTVTGNASTTQLGSTGSSYFATAGGNVGIGTTSPTAALHILMPASGVNLRLDKDSTNPQFTFANAATDVWGMYNSVADDTFRIRNWDDAVDVITITDSNNVGIGTTTPQWLLNPFSTTAAQLALSNGAGVAQWALRNAGGNLYIATTTVDGTATSSLSALSILGSSGYLGHGTTSPRVPFHIENNDPVILMYDSGGTISATRPAWQVGPVGGDFRISSTADYGLVSNSATTRITVVPTGLVGIGVTDPDTRLEVFETVSGNQLKLSYDATRYTAFQVTSVGDLVIDAQGGDASLLDENLFVCAGGSCPTGTPSGTGNLVVETALGVASSTPWAKISVGADGAIVTTEKTLTDGAGISVDFRNGNQQKVTLGANRTVTLSGHINGQTLRLVVCQDGTGTRTVTWATTPAGQLLWTGGSAPTLTTTANKCDVVSFLATGATSTARIFGASTLNF